LKRYKPGVKISISIPPCSHCYRTGTLLDNL
jgi:hypothetical protein